MADYVKRGTVREEVRTRLEYLLYMLALDHPDVLADAEQFTAAMLTNDMLAGDRARYLAQEFATEQKRGRYP